jgi:hypothetical protein
MTEVRSRIAIGLAVAVLVIGAAVIGVGLLNRTGPDPAAGPGPTDPSGTTGTTGTPSGSPAPSTGAVPAAWDAAQLRRFAAASALIATRSGHVGIVVRDRTTGLVWRGGEADYRIWAGSTPKLAFAVALREEARAGQITLDATANAQIAKMLNISDNNSADTLWNRYANKDPATWMKRFQTQYGMTTASYVSGFPSRWGFVKCSAQDLANLMSYILEKLDPGDRAYLLAAMQGVGAVQHWGVWGAGAALHPGVKDGWSVEKDDGKDHWITATVGFAGPDQRYVVAAMYHQLPGGDSIGEGVHTLTDLVATVFGAPVPAPATIPADY